MIDTNEISLGLQPNRPAAKRLIQAIYLKLKFGFGLCYGYQFIRVLKVELQSGFFNPQQQLLRRRDKVSG